MKPYTTWTLFDASAGHKLQGGFCSYRWYKCERDRIPSYWRDTLRDLAEYVGGL